MSSNVSRKFAAALLFATLVSLTAPPAAQARSFGARSFDGPVREQPARRFLSYLIRFFDFAGGAMDPNGHS